MILTCPERATRYSTTPDAIGPNGRTVRCSKCNTSWFVSAEPDIIDLHEQQRAEQVIRETPPEELYEDSEDVGFGSSEKEFSTAPVTGAHVQIRDMADQRRRNKRLMGISMIWFVTIAVLSLGAIMAFQYRQSIVEKYPATSSIYQALGITVNAFGLEFEDPTVRNMLVNGENTLVINGHIVSISNKTEDIPMIELSIVSKSKEKLASWIIEPPQPTLEAGERISYKSEYPNPPVDGDTIEYEFVTDDAIDEVPASP